jgi:hypothetical protein
MVRVLLLFFFTLQASCVPCLYETKGVLISGDDRLTVSRCNNEVSYESKCFPLVYSIRTLECLVYLETDINSEILIFRNSPVGIKCNLEFPELRWNDELDYYYYNIDGKDSGFINLEVSSKGNDSIKLEIVKLEYSTKVISRKIIIDAI